MPDKENAWKFERSSSYAGYRCQTCATWVHATDSKLCGCITHYGVCKHCGRSIIRSNTGEWFHFDTKKPKCEMEAPTAEPWGRWEENVVRKVADNETNRS